jgi:hypothetical protein
MDAYVAAIRILAKTCNFCDFVKDNLLRNRIVLGVSWNYRETEHSQIKEQCPAWVSAVAVVVCETILQIFAAKLRRQTIYIRHE